MPVTTAVCQVGHPASLESLVVMLEAVGVRCVLPSNALYDRLRGLGCDTVVDPLGMADGWGYDLGVKLDQVGEKVMADPETVYVDVKAHRNGPKVWGKWRNLKRRTLWYRINGGEPADVPDKGSELNPGCPVLTPNLWYQEFKAPPTNPLPATTLARSYACWPPFLKWDTFEASGRSSATSWSHGYYAPPVCILHNATGWGYGEVLDSLRQDVGLRCYGGYGSPDSLMPHRSLPDVYHSALALVHLKSNDAPGYALYEAMASGCPVILPRRFNVRCRTWDLFEEGATCLMYDFATEGALPEVEPYRERYTPVDVKDCVREIREALDQLTDPTLNRKIGEAGRERLRSLLWDPRKEKDVESLRSFLDRCFP
jgi:hypothetical protein